LLSASGSGNRKAVTSCSVHGHIGEERRRIGSNLVEEKVGLVAALAHELAFKAASPPVLVPHLCPGMLFV
jgi:predicted RNase H-related nuclease YkuK (DUF458 family)